jgi:hypothetical protein
MQGTGWQCLEVLDAMLTSHGRGQGYNDDMAAKLLAKVQELVREVSADSGLDADLRQFIVGHLHDIEKALTDAAIVGPHEMTVVANAMLGSAAREADLWDRVKQTRWAPRIVGAWALLCMSIGGVSDTQALMSGVDPDPTMLQLEHVQTPATDDDDGPVDGETVEDEDGGN